MAQQALVGFDKLWEALHKVGAGLGFLVGLCGTFLARLKRVKSLSSLCQLGAGLCFLVGLCPGLLGGPADQFLS
eukprot:1159010-Pelagomonas_calceolata.AAC.18